MREIDEEYEAEHDEDACCEANLYGFRCSCLKLSKIDADHDYGDYLSHKRRDEE